MPKNALAEWQDRQKQHEPESIGKSKILNRKRILAARSRFGINHTMENQLTEYGKHIIRNPAVAVIDIRIISVKTHYLLYRKRAVTKTTFALNQS